MQRKNEIFAGKIIQYYKRRQVKNVSFREVFEHFAVTDTVD